MSKLGFFLGALLVLIPIGGFSQSSNWNSIIDLNVTVSSGDRIDLYTDRDGNHVIVHKSNQLVYYLFNAAGSQVRTSVRDNFTEDPRLSKIIGYAGNLYIVYKKGSFIKTQKSTNGGATWSTTSVDDIGLTYSTVNGLEVWTDANGLHVAYSEEYDSNNGKYDTFYRMVPHNDHTWIDFKNVTDLTDEDGGFPSVTTSANRVHVAYTNSNQLWPGQGAGNPVKNRDRLNTTWQNPTTIFSNDASRCFIIATSSKLHAFYYEVQESPHSFSLEYKNQSLGSSSWSSAAQLQSASDPEIRHIDMAVTADDELHVVYYGQQYRVWDGSWSDPFSFASGSAYNQKISPNGNDVYVTWYEDVSGVYRLKLRQRDFAPLAPSGLTRSIVNSPNNNPRIDWSANPEADLDEYEVWKKKGSGNWNVLVTTPNTYYIDTGETGVSLNPQANNVEILYKLKAVDLQENKSDFSETITFNQSGGSQDKIAQNPAAQGPLPNEFTLYQNHPNPFNPITIIQFALPESREVEIAVYNLSGQKIAVLASGVMEAGIHQLQWDGKDQQGNPVSSGVYLYQLNAGNQRLVKKMMLIK